MRRLELLAPARNKEIGIAAIRCGADAVYIAAPAFGARQNAGNPVEDIRELCTEASRFGVRVFVTMNTLLEKEELPLASRLMDELDAAGVDALIIQDPQIFSLARGKGLRMALHASTQCAIRTVEEAQYYESIGCSRIVLERQLSLDEIRKIRDAVSCELEFFVHGALCVCYSGNCYLSEYLTGRSANRGACSQPCRSLYDLVDGNGRVLARNQALLSLKDLNLLDRLEELADAGIDSFKIEGRLKNISYVRNVTRAYSIGLDSLAYRRHGDYGRTSFGTVRDVFTPDVNRTFNRGYTELFLDGRKKDWAALTTPKSVGAEIGTVIETGPGSIRVLLSSPDIRLHNGDGFCFVSRGGEITGFRGDVCDGTVIRSSSLPEDLTSGKTIYRNLDTAFEKETSSKPGIREIRVAAEVSFKSGKIIVSAKTEDGRMLVSEKDIPSEQALDQERMLSIIEAQLGKRTGIYAFGPVTVSTKGEGLPLLSAGFLNSIRRELAEGLDAIPLNAIPQGINPRRGPVRNVSFREGDLLMRTRHCVRRTLGLCPSSEPLYLHNNGRTLTLRFDCGRCEMTVER